MHAHSQRMGKLTNLKSLWKRRQPKGLKQDNLNWPILPRLKMKIIEIDSKTYRKNMSDSFAKFFFFFIFLSNKSGLYYFTLIDIYINSFLSLIYDHKNQWLAIECNYFYVIFCLFLSYMFLVIDCLCFVFCT